MVGLCCSTALKGADELTEVEINNLREVLRAVAYELRCIIVDTLTIYS